jgi:RNA polymerase sigma-70 factor (ECF subfamily)
VAATIRLDFSQLRRDLERAVARLCPTWLVDRRDDLVQAAVMRVMHVAARADGRNEGNAIGAASYLHKVAYSALVDEVRRVRRRREISLDEVHAPPVPSNGSPERLAAANEIGSAIRECLQDLKRERRLAVTLHLQGHSVPDAARILGWTVKRTENLVYRGLADLRAGLLARGIRP